MTDKKSWGGEIQNASAKSKDMTQKQLHFIVVLQFAICSSFFAVVIGRIQLNVNCSRETIRACFTSVAKIVSAINNVRQCLLKADRLFRCCAWSMAYDKHAIEWVRFSLSLSRQ